MELVPLAQLVLLYDDLETLEYDAGAQHYGHMHGSLSGERLAGSLQLTNIATGRPDGVNLPTLRGLLRTDGDALVWVELDGFAVWREDDAARLFVTSVRLRSGDERLAWVNTVLGVLEGRLDSETGEARGQLFECRPDTGATPQAPAHPPVGTLEG